MRKWRLKKNQGNPAYQSSTEPLLILQDQLVKACEEGQDKQVQIALKKGAKPDLPDSKGKHPLAAAIYGMNPLVVDQLLKNLHGKMPLSWEDCERHNLKHYKVMWVFPDIVPGGSSEWTKYLQEANAFILNKIVQDVASIDTSPDRFYQVVSEIVGYKTQIKTKIQKLPPKTSPPIGSRSGLKSSTSSTTSSFSVFQDELTKACEKGDEKAVQVALSKGAKPNLLDKQGKHPLAAAVYSMNYNVVLELIRHTGGISPLTWEECEQHNLRHYEEIWPLPENIAFKR